MKKTFPIILILLVLAVGAWAAATFFFSSTTSAWLGSELEKLKQQSGASGLIDFDQTDYKKGFLVSEATTTLVLNNVPLDNWNGLKLNHRIYHGPLAKTPDGFKIGSNYMVTTMDLENLPVEAREVIEKGFGGKEPFLLTVNSGFGKSMTANLEVPSFALDITEDGEDAQVEFAGLSGQFSGSQTSGEGGISIGALKVEDRNEDFTLSTEAGTVTVDVRKMVDEIPVDAEAEYLFPSVSFTTEGKDFRFEDITANYEVHSEDGGNSLDGSYSFKYGKVKLPVGEEMDQLRPIFGDGGELAFSVKGMTVQALEDLMEAQKKMQEAQSAMLGKGTSEMTPESIRSSQEAGLAYMRSVFDMIQKDFGFGISLSFGASEQESKAALNLTFTGEGKSTDLKTLGELIGAFSGDLTLRLNKGLIPAEQAAMMAQPIAQGFILDKGTHYESAIKMADSVVDMNGKPMSLMEQLGPQAEMPIPWDQIFQGGAMMQMQ